MTSSSAPAPSSNEQPRTSDVDPPSTGFASVARRLASRTTDLIAVGVVLIGSLTFGRQAVVWWRTEPEEISRPVAAVEASNPWNAAPVEIEFGDAPLSLNRQKFSGDREAALVWLTAECRGIAESPAAVPLESPAADAMLSKLSKLTPVEGDPGNWSIYRLEEQFSLVVAVRHESSADARGAAPAARLLCFGMAVPAGDSEWTLFLFRGAKGSTSEGGLLSSDIFPDGFRRLLSLRGQQGELLTGVAGRGEAESWKKSLETKLQSRGWHVEGQWSAVDRTWSAQFGRTGVDGEGTIGVVMTSDGDGGWTGLIHQSP